MLYTTQTTLTLGGDDYNLMPMPVSPGIASIELEMNETTSLVQSPFTKKSQVQTRPGSDFWSATVNLPPMYYGQAAQWEAFLASLQGQLGCFQLGDPRTVNLPVVAAPTVSFVSALIGRGNTASTFAVETGQTICLLAHAPSSDTSANVTDNLGNTYTRTALCATGDPYNPYTLAVWIAQSITNGACTINPPVQGTNDYSPGYSVFVLSGVYGLEAQACLF